MRAVIKPSVAKGVMQAPPSKSMAHRMLICAGLSCDDAPSLIHGLEPSEDVLATIDCLQALGARIDFDAENGTACVYGAPLVQLRTGAIQLDAPILPCRECGSTLRFFVPLALVTGLPVQLTGSPTLMNRPLGVYKDICTEQNLGFQMKDGNLHVQGPLASGAFRFAGNISSQFISGLLFALPLLEGESTIELTGGVESRSYIGMTLQALEIFGVNASWTSENTLRIPGNQRYRSLDCTVEGDWSNAAFFDALTTLGGNVQVTGLREDSLQGDKVYRQHLDALASGCPTIDLSDCPDLGPVLMAVAGVLHGATFIGCKRLAIKESNRGKAMADELAKCDISVSISEDGDTIVVDPSHRHAARQAFDGHNDHRIVMALCVLSTLLGGEVTGAEAVRKSLPNFFERLSSLKVEVELHEMD